MLMSWSSVDCGGPNKPTPPMYMQWHHLAFNEKEQVGYGEFTFQMNLRYRGIVTVQIQVGKIANWREYEYQSNSRARVAFNINVTAPVASTNRMYIGG
jgi:hypothetical protein